MAAVIQTPETVPARPAGGAQSATPSVRQEPSDWTALRSASVSTMETVTTSLELVRDGVISVNNFYMKKT